MQEFLNYCLPAFLQKGDIYEKIFHEKQRFSYKRRQLVQVAEHLWEIHQTFSSKKLPKHVDAEPRKQKVAQKQESKKKTSMNSSLGEDDYKILKINAKKSSDESKNFKFLSKGHYSSFKTFGKMETFSAERLEKILRKPLLGKRNPENDSAGENALKRQRFNGKLMNFLIDTNNNNRSAASKSSNQ